MPQEVNIQKRWTKMLADTISRNKLPPEFLSISQNARIKDWCLTKRPWQKTRVTFSDLLSNVKRITYNKTLYIVVDKHLWKVNMTDWTKTDIWSIWDDSNVELLNYGKYIMIFNWVWKPYVYNWDFLFQLWDDTYNPAYLTWWNAPTKVIATWKAVLDWSFNITIDWTLRSITWLNFSTVSTLADVCLIIQNKIRSLTSWLEKVEFTAEWIFKISSWNITSTSAITVTSAAWTWTDISGAWATQFLDCDVWATWELVVAKTLANSPDVNPIIADKFTWFTFMFWNTEGKDNVLYISKPITAANPERCYNWLWTTAENIDYSCKWLWLRWTMNKMFIFTEDKIEYIWKDSLQTIGSVATLVSTPIGSGWQPASQGSIVAAWSMIFYLTKNNTINTVDYAQWTVEPTIWTLTNEVQLKITNYLKNLDEDQSWSRGYYDENTKEILWSLKTKNSLYNDTTLVYDLENKTRTTDKWKLFSDVVVVWNKTYAWSSINASIIENWIGLDDDWNAIEFEIQDTDVMLWTLKEKIFSWRQTSGWLNKATNLEFRTLIDDSIASLEYIKWIDYVSIDDSFDTAWIWDDEIWGDAIWWLINTWLTGGYTQFDKLLDHWNLYRRWKRIKRNIRENSVGSDFYLDFYTIIADVTWNIELTDKF